MMRCLANEFQIHLFINSANAHISKIATELLEKENPTMQQLKTKVKETENATWYNQRKEYDKMANIKKDKFSKPCNSKTRFEADCWGLVVTADIETIKQHIVKSKRHPQINQLTKQTKQQ